jgi:hypothetical protein
MSALAGVSILGTVLDISEDVTPGVVISAGRPVDASTAIVELAFGIISMPDVSAFIGSAAIVGALGVIDGMSAPVGIGVTVLVSDA